MPTHEERPEFLRDFDRLTTEQKAAFLRALRRFVEDLASERGFRAGLRVKPVQASPRVWEMTWAPDGRATFEYGEEVRPGDPHIIWRRIGTHAIFRRP